MDQFRKYKNFDPGQNCRENYNPAKTGKSCLKCFTKRNDKGRHFEFDCTKYNRISKSNCRKCRRGFHLESECNSNNYPPNFNSIMLKVTEKVTEQIGAHLREILDEPPKN